MTTAWVGYNEVALAPAQTLLSTVSDAFPLVARREKSRRTATGTPQPPQSTGWSAIVRMRFPSSETPLEIGFHFWRSFAVDLYTTWPKRIARLRRGKRLKNLAFSPHNAALPRGVVENLKSSWKKINSASCFTRENGLHYYCYVRTFNSVIKLIYVWGRNCVSYIRNYALRKELTNFEKKNIRENLVSLI